VVSRESLLKEAEKLFKDLGNTKAILEVQYENEVGHLQYLLLVQSYVICNPFTSTIILVICNSFYS